MPDEAVLDVAGLEGFYGDSQVLHGVDLGLRRGEVVTLVGRNGAGKTTTLRAVMGILESRRGSIRLFGREVIAAPPERIARLGVGYVPEERGVYASLTVLENLLLPPVIASGGMSMEERAKRASRRALATARWRAMTVRLRTEETGARTSRLPRPSRRSLRSLLRANGNR
jgi:ABC-type branched-subunit amino acid transport system ATPase component